MLDVAARRLVASIPTGRYPYALTLVGSRVFVANIGQFAYSPVGPPRDPRFDKRGLTFPPFAYPSREAERGVEVEGRRVPGLGKPRVPEAFSVYGYDVSNPLRPRLASITKTGTQIGARSPQGHVVGGSGPSFVLGVGDSVYASNSNDDTVDEIRASTGRIVGRISLEPSPLVHGIRGVQPTGLAVSADKTRLFVAESGLNAIAVVDRAARRVVGLIPTAWYPYRVASTSDGRNLACICFKGYGNGPNGGAHPAKDPFAHLQGSFHTIPIPTDAELATMTQTVLADNGLVDASADYPKMRSPVWSSASGERSDAIRYVVFITKENHTFDTIFDRVPGSDNDPSLLRWGLDQTVSAPGQPTLTHVPVMTNHNALARGFTVSDNFYMEPEASGVGHRWLIGIQPNNFCQMLYTLGWDYKLKTPAAGRRAAFREQRLDGAGGLPRGRLHVGASPAGRRHPAQLRRGIRVRRRGRGRRRREDGRA